MRNYSEIIEIISKWGNHKFVPKNKSIKLSRCEFSVFMSICKLKDSAEPLKASDIANYLKMTKPQLSMNLNSLERKGLIKRTISLIDRRRADIDITEKGRKMEMKSLCLLKSVVDEYYEVLGEEDMDKLIDILGKIEDYWEEENV